jgi:hypothetical protein
MMNAQSKRQISSADQVRKNRQVLFEEATTTFQSQQQVKQRGRHKSFSNNNTDNNTAVEAASIQTSLSRTQGLLKNELQRISQVSTAIEEDGKLLQTTKDTHLSLNVKQAKHALTSLQRAQQQEYRVLLSSIVFFWTVVAYILFVRVIMHIPFVAGILQTVQSSFVQLVSQVVNVFE